MILKNWLGLPEAQEKLLKKNYMKYSVLLNKDQQKMVVKLFFLVYLKIYSQVKICLNFLLMNLLGLNRTQQTLLFINEATIILSETFL